jgi:hypothetical protein
MLERDPGVDELDMRLAEVDRQLSAIQDELVSVGEAAPGPSDTPDATAPSAAVPSVAGGFTGPPAGAADPQARLLASLRELLGAYESLLAGLSAQRQSPPQRDLVVSAGPFTSTDGLRAFERALSVMPGVREVIVREYAGEDRAIVDVRLDDPTS